MQSRGTPMRTRLHHIVIMSSSEAVRPSRSVRCPASAPAVVSTLAPKELLQCCSLFSMYVHLSVSLLDPIGM